MDRVLLFALFLAVAFDVNGIRWGRVECWNRDQMALRNLRSWGMPDTYAKPPLHTFINHILVTGPTGIVERAAGAVTGEKQYFNEVKVLLSRLVVLALFLGTILVTYKTCELYFNRAAARFAALALASSAGFVTFNHFLSCDSPLLFFIMATGLCAARIYVYGTRLDYILTGLLVGAATNTKYNGLGVGITLVAAHVLRPGLSWKERFFSKDLFCGLGMVPAGLFVTNPFMVFDFKSFRSDFMYNYTITPQYDGSTDRFGYAKFFAAVPEILGWPGTVLLGICAVGSALAVAARKVPRRSAAGFAIVASFVLLYTLKMGAFPRMETRFVLPVVPFAILLAGPFLMLNGAVRWGVAALCAPVLAYNLVCSAMVGERFKADPRLAAQDWIKAHAKPGFRIESSGRAPHWWKISSLKAREIDATKPDWKSAQGAKVLDFRMQRVTGRLEMFGRVFKGNKWVEDVVGRREKPTADGIFTAEALAERNPDVIAVIADDLKVPNPASAEYYQKLLSEELPYRVIFDRSLPEVACWVYPREIDFLDRRTVLLGRK